MNVDTIIAVALVAWLACGLLGVYLESRRSGDLNSDSRLTIFALGLIALLLVLVDCIADAGENAHK